MARRSGTLPWVTLVCGVALALVATLQAQAPQPPAPLTIAGDIPKTVTLAVADLKNYPRTTASVQEEGRTVTYDGVLLGEVLSRAGAPLGPELRGNNVASYVLATARSMRMLERLEIVRLRK
jgi:hypothetical protein